MPTLSIGARILAAVALPSLALLVAASALFMQASRSVSDAELAADALSAVQAASDVAHMLQRERGASALYIGAQGESEFAERLEAARAASNAAIAAYAVAQNVYAQGDALPTLTEALAAADQRLGQLRARRTQVSELELDVAGMAEWYGGAIRSLLDAETPLAAVMTGSGESAALLGAYGALLEAKEAAGQERAFGSAGFSAGAFDRDLHDRFAAREVMQQVRLDIADGLLLPRLRPVFAAALAGPERAEVERLRAIARHASSGGAANRVSGGEWYDAATAWIDRLRALELRLAAELRDVAAATEASARRALALDVVGSAAAILLAAALGLFTARAVARPLHDLGDRAQAAGRGEDIEIPQALQARRDEIGVFARNLGQIQQATDRARRLVSALDAVGAPVAVIDERQKVTYVNPAFTALARALGPAFAARGVDPDALAGVPVSRLLPDGLTVDGLLAAAGRINEAELGRRRLRVSGAPIVNARGEALGAAFLWSDVTELRALQSQLQAVVDGAGDGDFSRRLDETADDPFLQELCTGLNRVCGVIEGFAGDMDAAVRAMAEGDLTVRVSGEHRGRFRQLAGGVNDTAARLEETLLRLKELGGRVRESSGDMAEGAGGLAQRAEGQAAALEETAAQMEEMTASVKSNAEAAAEARGAAEDAGREAESGQQVVEETVAAMTRLSESSGRMTDIVDVIASIAFQTNLLALNAAVEAARAGPAGKGFAVVASEVGALAQRSREAAEDIKRLISESGGRVAEGVDLAERSGEALSRMSQVIERIGGLIRDIDLAGREQALGIQEIAQAVAHMDEATQRNSGLADDSARASQSLAQDSAELDALISRYRTAAAPAAARAPDRAPDRSPDRTPGRAAA
ncbi:MAG: nitrate- and nitrite sensing domain-containing protein [Pseudomonadota bacterium]